jgi:single-stranded-DNA-specific exonuclease
MKKIIKRNVENHFANATDLHPVLQRVYSARGVQSKQELERSLDQLLPFQSLLNIDKAVAILADAIFSQKKILIVGDFDADGATSTAVAVRALKSFGAKHVEFLVPNRFEFGYGLTPELVQVACTMNPDLIVTVDNGIANHAGVIAAKEKNIQVVITDHHLPAETLPPADTIVNPNQHGCPFPSKNIAGVGVIFYCMLALRRYLSEQKWFEKEKIPEPNMSRLLDLVALGTVADVVSLDQNNRILVYQGLRRIRAKQCVPGISAILEVAERNQTNLVASDLGFSVAPRLNAAGRLDDMSVGIECLITDNAFRAREIAQLLNQLNDERRVIEQDMQEHAIKILNSFPEKQKNFPRGVSLFDAEWHQGVIGILASRIKDRLHRPVIAFALANETELKGSARSIPGLHIRDVLAEVAIRSPELILKFGGHAMAAGLTVSRQLFEKFSKMFDEVVSEKMNDEQLSQILLTDGELSSTDLNLPLAETIREAGPWGQSFPEPVFEGEFAIIDQRLVGGKHLKLLLESEGKSLNAIAFNVDLNQWPNYRCDKIKVVYRLDVNEFRGKRSVQLIVEHIA